MEKNNSTLILASTSLGNDRDIPVRSLEALREADLLLFEEPKRARGFLKAAGIHRDFLKFSEHNEKETLEAVKQCLSSSGRVVYMSDQGMPSLADPGEALTEIAFRMNAKIQVIPGPCSVSTALAACPFSVEPHYYAGFLPRKPEERKRKLRELAQVRSAIVILETPYRRTALLESCAEVFPSRRALLALDLTGPEEDYWLGSTKALYQRSQALQGKLNFVLVLASPA